MYKILPSVILISIIAILHLSGAPLRDVPQQITQPDGTVLHCYASGDEYHNWLHDENGYTIIQNPVTGFYVYADKLNGELVPTELIAGRDDPAAAGLQTEVNISPVQVTQIREEFEVHLLDVHRQEFDGISKSTYQQTSYNELNNLVIFIRFSDDDEFEQATSFYDSLYNEQGDRAISLYEYYQEASYGQFEIFSSFYPESSVPTVISYQDSNPRAYYEPMSPENEIGYDPDVSHGDGENPDGRTYREHTLLKNAVEYVESEIPHTINLDNNGNGMVDCVSFIVRGGPVGWNNLLWPHRWVLFSQNVTIHGKRVWDYTFQLEESSNSNGNTIRLGTIAHEMFHILGAPDLYRYDSSGLHPVGPWDIMAATSNTPQHMGAYMKYFYGGWIDGIPEITESGSYELEPLHSHNESCFKIRSANSPNEFFVVEYRNHDSIFDSIIPGEGLIVYRINKMSEGLGNHYAPDEVYIYRPSGAPDKNGNIFNAHFSADNGRTEISDNTAISAFLSDGSDGGLHISNIGNAGATISFDVIIDYEPPVVLQYDSGDVFSGMGYDSAGDIEVAVRFTEDELGDHYGRDLSAVYLYVNEGGGNNITLKVWEGGAHGDAGNLVHSEYIGHSIVLGQWTKYILDEPIQLFDGEEYWVGYHIEASGGFPIGMDGGSVVDGKGAWVNTQSGWEQLHNLSDSFDSNFRIRAAIEGDAVTSVPVVEVPETPRLHQNYPNPFNPTTTIRYNVPAQSHVTLEVFNRLGQLVRTLTDTEQSPGVYDVIFDGSGLPSGVYFYRLQITGNGGDIFDQSKRFVLVK